MTPDLAQRLLEALNFPTTLERLVDGLALPWDGVPVWDESRVYVEAKAK